ncbi:uncharacterized protein HD556DRAFT_1417414 [Suillus plorans]|uniref:F-box domain-containing protein n=1 Tax=Suillus plorans TaxID=116603 RepID=A0A9P7ABR4_9AGAM|nr:uncharacterized protein HD556DRAFT_1417414 [Suillus plorans]KAG1786087.1 hypothetical protein HD556DRAFT_1417414 [Suillus plorans]
MPKSLFLSLFEELRVYILGFLSFRYILCCASVCKALRQTYMSSSELQYIVELSGQCLLPVSITGDHTPISERLQRLRDKAHAWLKFNVFAFQTGTLPIPFPNLRCSTGEYLYSWIHHSDLVTISPIPSKYPQQTIEHEWSPKTLCPSIFTQRVKYILMDPAQNLFGIMYIVDNMAYRIYLTTLDDGHVHPHAAGPALNLELSVYAFDVKLKCYGRHIALWRDCETSRFLQTPWHLQIWDWQHSTTSSRQHIHQCQFLFSRNDRLLVFDRELELYSIEDTSKTPRLLARFQLPFPLVNLESDHSSQPKMQTQAQSVYTSDPKHRLLCVYSLIDDVRKIFVISTKIFFDIDQAAVKPWRYKPWRYGIPWQHWGPGHVRVLKYKARNKTKIHLCGNRVLLVDKITSKTHAYKLRMMDFSPLAVANRRGLGRVVKERSTTTSGSYSEWPDQSWDNITHWHSTIEKSMPYVEVVSSRKIAGGGWLQDVWMDDDRIYLVFVTSCSRDRKLQVIDIY